MAFPDDDCVYPPGAARTRRDAIRGGHRASTVSRAGSRTNAAASSASWKPDSALLTRRQPLEPCESRSTIFLRRDARRARGAVRRATRPRLARSRGHRARRPTTSSARCDAGARIEYDPSLVVRHDVRPDDARIGYRDGASVGYLLRKHDYPSRVVARMLVRPIGGALVSLVRLDGAAGPLSGSRRCAVAFAATVGTRLSEELGVAVEPGLEREVLDGSRPRGDGVRARDRAGRESPRRPAPPAQAARPARSRRDAARRCPPRRRRAPERRRCADRRREAPTPSPRSRRSGTGRSPSCGAGGARDGRAPARRPASSGRATWTRPREAQLARRAARRASRAAR